jgi:hypothetical protein
MSVQGGNIWVIAFQAHKLPEQIPTKPAIPKVMDAIFRILTGSNVLNKNMWKTKASPKPDELCCAQRHLHFPHKRLVHSHHNLLVADWMLEVGSQSRKQTE